MASTSYPRSARHTAWVRPRYPAPITVTRARGWMLITSIIATGRRAGEVFTVVVMPLLQGFSRPFNPPDRAGADSARARLRARVRVGTDQAPGRVGDPGQHQRGPVRAGQLQPPPDLVHVPRQAAPPQVS